MRTQNRKIRKPGPRPHVAVALALGTALFLAGAGAGPGTTKADTLYSESLVLNQTFSSDLFGAEQSPLEYEHHNPTEIAPLDWTPQEYLDAADNGMISVVDLSVDLGGLGLLESVKIQIEALTVPGWTDLGIVIGDGTHTFSLLDPQYGFGPTGGIDGLPVKLQLFGWDGSGPTGMGAEATLIASTLTVGVGDPEIQTQSQAVAAPLPAAAWAGLAMLGARGGVGGIRRRFHRNG